MTFEKALEAMRKGEKVTKKSWANKNWLWLSEKFGMPAICVHFVNKNTSDIWESNAFELADDDWEVVDGKPMLSFERLPELTARWRLRKTHR